MKLFSQSTIARLILAAIIGALIGLFAHFLRGINGYPLFIIIGAIAGVAIGSLIQLYLRTVRLTEITVTVPQLSQLTFAVNKDDKQTAWELFIEVATRVSTQPLGQNEGFLREALNSLYQLFGQTREILKKAQPTKVKRVKTVEYLALSMLNRELRPFLSKWHLRLSRFETSGGADEASWPENDQFRAELEMMRKRLLEFALAFARLAGVPEPQALVQE
ncbi:MAG: hypothetical protein ACREXR_01890 [Gammaproteobacteria bacterium]